MTSIKTYNKILLSGSVLVSKAKEVLKHESPDPKYHWLTVVRGIGTVIIVLFSFDKCCPVLAPLFFLVVLFAFFVFVTHWVINTYATPDYNSDKSGEDHSFSFMVRNVFVPLLVGFMAMMVAESINPNKIPVIVAVGDSHSEYQFDYRGEMEDEHIDPAVRTLGDFNEIFDMRVIGVKPYEQLLADVTRGKVDLGGIPPFEYVFYDWLFDPTRTDTATENNYLNSLRSDYKKVRVLGFKSTAETGNYFFPGILFHRAGNSTWQKLEDDAILIDTLIKEARKKNDDGSCKVQFYASTQQLSSSGRNLPISWLIKNGLAPNWVENTSIVSSNEVLSVLEDWVKPDSFSPITAPQRTKHRVAFFSSNQWIILKKYKPETAKKYRWVPIKDLPIPYDPIIVNDSLWKDKFDGGFQRWWDMVTLRNVNFLKSRQHIIIESLQSFMTEPINMSDTLWRQCNRDFMDVLRSGTVVLKCDTLLNLIHVCLPAPFDVDGRQLSYKFVPGTKYNLAFYELARRKDYNRFDLNKSFVYPKEKQNLDIIKNAIFVKKGASTRLDKGIGEYIFKVDSKSLDKIKDDRFSNKWVLPKGVRFQLTIRE